MLASKCETQHTSSRAQVVSGSMVVLVFVCLQDNATATRRKANCYLIRLTILCLRETSSAISQASRHSVISTLLMYIASAQEFLNPSDCGGKTEVQGLSPIPVLGGLHTLASDMCGWNIGNHNPASNGCRAVHLLLNVAQILARLLL